MTTISNIMCDERRPPRPVSNACQPPNVRQRAAVYVCDEIRDAKPNPMRWQRGVGSVPKRVNVSRSRQIFFRLRRNIWTPPEQGRNI